MAVWRSGLGAAAVRTGYEDVSRPRKSAPCRPSSPAAGALPTGHVRIQPGLYHTNWTNEWKRVSMFLRHLVWEEGAR